MVVELCNNCKRYKRTGEQCLCPPTPPPAEPEGVRVSGTYRIDCETGEATRIGPVGMLTGAESPEVAGLDTNEYRAAMSRPNDPPFLSVAYEWQDKPHRLVFDLCNEVDRLRLAARSTCSGVVGVPGESDWQVLARLAIKDAGFAIMAIKYCRQETGLYLPEAKAMVDAYKEKCRLLPAPVAKEGGP
jgi:hypothetical protein